MSQMQDRKRRRRQELSLIHISEAAIANREIVEIALEEEIPQRNICMVYDIHHPISAAARALTKVITDSSKI